MDLSCVDETGSFRRILMKVQRGWGGAETGGRAGRGPKWKPLHPGCCSFLTVHKSPFEWCRAVTPMG